MDGDWYEGRPESKYEAAPPPPPPPKRVLIEVPDLPDEELEASDKYLRFKVWRGLEDVTFWIPVTEVQD
jgi:hypothetical protein